MHVFGSFAFHHDAKRAADAKVQRGFGRDDITRTHLVAEPLGGRPGLVHHVARRGHPATDLDAQRITGFCHVLVLFLLLSWQHRPPVRRVGPPRIADIVPARHWPAGARLAEGGIHALCL